MLLQDEKFSKEKSTVILFKVIFTKMCFTKFSLEITQELLQTALNFSLNFFFPFGTLRQKSSLLFPSCTIKYISQECHNVHIEPESVWIFQNISSLTNSNSRTKF